MATAYIETTIPSSTTMKLADNPPKLIDEVITEVRAIKRAIALRHDDDIDRLLEALIAQEHATGINRPEQTATRQPAPPTPDSHHPKSIC